MSSPFESFPDPDFRAILNESLDNSLCRSILGMSYDFPPDVIPSFPPEPTYYLVETAAYLSSEDQWVVKKKSAGLGPLEAKKKALNLYKATVNPRHQSMRALLRTTRLVEGLGTERAIQEFCIRAVQATGSRLLAAHIIGEERDSGRLVDALVVPRVISEGIPLQIRDSIVPYLSNNTLTDTERQTLRQYTDLDPRHRETATIAAASFLPSATIVARALQAMPGK